MNEEIDNRPKNAFEAAIDAATGYEPGDEDRVVVAAEQDGQDESGGAEAAEVGSADGETKPAEVKENAAPVKEKRDWVNEAYECFIENAVDLEPTDPVKAIAAYFEKNAADNLKMKVEHEGKTAKGCWKFIEAVAKKALGSRSGHIDPVAVYAIAMHYFQDVPKDWDKAEKAKPKTKAKAAKDCGQTEKNGYRSNDSKDVSAVRRSQIIAHKRRMKDLAIKTDKVYADKVAHDLDDLDKKYPVKKPKVKAKKRGGEQGFFFDLMETETVGPDEGNGGVAAAEQDGKEAGDAE